MGFVLLTGVDKSSNGMIKTTVQVAKPFAISRGTKQVIPEKPFWLVGSTGHTFFEATRNLTNQSPRRLYWAHNRVLIIDEELAREGLDEIIDILLRENQVRGSLRVLIARGSAEEILDTSFELERSPYEALEGITEVVAEMKSTSITPILVQMAREMGTEGIETVTGAVEPVVRPQPKSPQQGLLEEKVIGTSARLSGLGVFKGLQLVGFLNERESRGLLWVKGEVKGGSLAVMHPTDEGRQVSLKLLGGKSKITPLMVDGRPVIRVRIEAKANLEETQGEARLIGNHTFWHRLERRMAAAIRNEVESALTAAQGEYQSDIFGFGRSIYIHYPREWMEMRDNWYDIFPTLEVEVEVIAHLERSGLTLQRLKAR